MENNEKQITFKPMKSTKLLGLYGKKIESACKNPAKVNRLINHIKRYFDKNNEAFFAQAPLSKVLFSNNDQDILVEFLDEDPNKFNKDFIDNVVNTYSKTEYKWVTSVHLLKFAFSFLTLGIARQFYLMKKKAEAEILLMYLSAKAYSSLMHKLFPLAIKREVMMYTIQTLSNRYKYTRLGNNYNVLKDTTLGAIDTYYKHYIQFDDGIYPVLFNQIYNRIKNNLLLIAKNYYDNNANRRYLNTVNSTDSETNSQMELEDSSGMISSIADAATINFTTKLPNIVIIKELAKQSDVSYAALLHCVDEARKRHPPEKINKLFSAILTLVYDSDHSLLSRIRSKDFIITARKQISVALSNNPALQVVKDESEHILMNYCSKFVQTNRAATKTSYRQALYYYMVYIIVGSKG